MFTREEKDCECVGLCTCDKVHEETIEELEAVLAEKERERDLRDYNEDYPSQKVHCFSKRPFCTNPEDYEAIASNSKIDIKGYENTFKEALEKTCSKCKWKTSCKRYSVCPKIEAKYYNLLKRRSRLKVGDKVVYSGYNRICRIIKDGLSYRLLDLENFVMYARKYMTIDDIIEDIQL